MATTASFWVASMSAEVGASSTGGRRCRVAADRMPALCRIGHAAGVLSDSKQSDLRSLVAHAEGRQGSSERL